MIMICWLIIAPGRSLQVQGPQFTHPWPAQFQRGPKGTALGGEGEVAVGRLVGRVCFLSLTPTAPAWRKWQGLCGYLWCLPCLTGAKSHSLPCSVSLIPAGKSLLPLFPPLRNRRDALLLPGFQKQQVSLPVPGQGLRKAGRCPPLLL